MVFKPSHRAILLASCATLAYAGCSSEQATGPAPVAVDSLAPVISLFLGPPGPAALGGEIQIQFTVRDDVGVKQTILSAQGAFEGVDTLAYTERPKAISVTYSIPVPDEVKADLSVVFTLVVFDDAGHTKEGQSTVTLADLTPPQARLDLGGLHGDETIRSGETLDIYINAGDNHRLAYIGYAGGGHRDSVRASSMGDSHVFQLTVPSSWLMNRPVLSAWARDAAGQLSPGGGIGQREVPVYNWADHPVFIIPVSPDEYPLDVQWDAKRNSVYRLRLNPGGESSHIDGVEVLSGAAVPPITLAAAARSFAFTGSGDSLVVTLPFEPALGIVDLRPAQRSVSMMPLQYESEATRYPDAASASGGRFFVSLAQGLNSSRLLEVSFATGAHVIRTDIDGGADAPPSPSLLQLPDGRLVIAPERPEPFPEQVVYTPGTNTFALTRRLRPVSRRQYSASPSQRFMMGNTVFGPTLDSLATVSTQDWGYPSGTPAALSADGLSVFLSTRYGYQKVRLSDGLILEQGKLEMTPLYLFASPDGNRLIAVGASAVRVVRFD